MLTRASQRIAVGVLTVLGAASAGAATIDWNTWTSPTTGTISTPDGPITVTFSGGPTDNLVPNYPSYTPTATYADGSVVANAPTAANGILQITGGTTGVNTVQFSAPVLDPVMAIWSLGQGGVNASFNFTNATPVFVSGGPSAEYTGGPITVSGNSVYGSEGNGTVEFLGTYTSISWTNPTYEYWYGFNVGTPETASVPEPAALSLLGLGLVGLGLRRRRTTT